MSMSNMKIGTRLGLGFGIVSLLMVVLIVVAIHHFQELGGINKRLVDEDWVKAEAVATIDATTRANARRNLEFFIETDPARIDFLFADIARNKKTIDDAVVVLDNLVVNEKGKAFLEQFKELRGKYVASFGRVGALIREQQPDAARQLMQHETLPALDALQKVVADLGSLQKDFVVQSGLTAGAHIDSALRWMIGLGIAAILIGLACAWVMVIPPKNSVFQK